MKKFFKFLAIFIGICFWLIVGFIVFMAYQMGVFEKAAWFDLPYHTTLASLERKTDTKILTYDEAHEIDLAAESKRTGISVEDLKEQERLISELFLGISTERAHDNTFVMKNVSLNGYTGDLTLSLFQPEFTSFLNQEEKEIKRSSFMCVSRYSFEVDSTNLNVETECRKIMNELESMDNVKLMEQEFGVNPENGSPEIHVKYEISGPNYAYYSFKITVSEYYGNTITIEWSDY